MRTTGPGVTLARSTLAAAAGGLATKGGVKDQVPAWVKNDRQVRPRDLVLYSYEARIQLGTTTSQLKLQTQLS